MPLSIKIEVDAGVAFKIYFMSHKETFYLCKPKHM